MVSPASSLALQPLTRPLPEPVRLPDLVGPWAAAPCDCCHGAPATFTLTWPDARFRVCSPCLPTTTPAGSVLGVVAFQAAPGPAPASWARPATTRPSGCAGSVGAAPTRTLASSSTAQATGNGQPVLSAAAAERAEREVLRAAARTVLTSPPSPRGRRLSRNGGCDVVAALVLAAGGAVDQTGRPTDPTERAAAELLRRALRRVADQVAGCATGRTWTGDPVVLIDAWQAHPGLSRSARAAVLTAAADPAPHPNSPRAATSAGVVPPTSTAATARVSTRTQW